MEETMARTRVGALVGAIVILTAACSGTASSSPPASQPAASQPAASQPAGSAPASQPAESPSAGYGFATVAQDPTAPITVWVDADRTPITAAFKTDHPECKLNVETYDASAGGSDTFHQKITLLDQAGSGWPDIAWSGQVNDASWAAHEQNGVQAFAAPLDQGVVPQSWLDGYTPGALDPVTVDGHVYGARDNLAPVVLWYNKTLLDKFGYTVPTTWEEYQALGDKLAAEHPGYILGSIFDPFTAVLTDMWAAQAPIYTVDGKTFTSDFSDGHSTRMIALLDHMFANKTLALDGLFTPDWVKKWKDKVVAIPGPTWFAGGIIQNKDNLNAPAGTWAAGHALHWAGEPIATGNVGGGFWYGSSHSANLACVATFLQYATSGPQSVKLITGLPAYATTASAWLDAQTSSGYWADSATFKDVVSEAANNIWKGWGATLPFSAEPPWAEVVAPALAAGKTIASQVGAWQQSLAQQAQVNGFTVVTK
jgi:multiple sugar transport system substrate-binding protein